MSTHDDSQDRVKRPIGGLIGSTEEETAAELKGPGCNVFAAAVLPTSERFEILSVCERL